MAAVLEKAKLMGNAALDAALNAQLLVQIGVFTAVPMIMSFILELGLLKLQWEVFHNKSASMSPQKLNFFSFLWLESAHQMNGKEASQVSNTFKIRVRIR
ncbi:unnamed protein product [Trifolium pratense]|uniref:Uncharacterized protein n=1 Tax=Trifolium pratense TaxID=57577 RepID=A0ACB0JN50_TRIPR|nr:unnamed protein product [Trifolium pratense]